MPIHDWTRVSAGTWHAFHLSWLAEIQLVLNDGVLSSEYYAQAEQIAGPLGPDVLTLQSPEPQTGRSTSSGSNGAACLTVDTSPPRPTLVAEAEMSDYVLKRRTITIRHASGDQIIALIEIVSPGNKASRSALVLVQPELEKRLDRVSQ